MIVKTSKIIKRYNTILKQEMTKLLNNITPTDKFGTTVLLSRRYANDTPATLIAGIGIQVKFVY